MVEKRHKERHFTAADILRDIVIGMSDGLTVPFALAAGLASAVNSTRLIVIAGIAEIAAGSIAMGLGGYLAAKSDVEHYDRERLREQKEVKETPAVEQTEVMDVFRSYGLTPEESAPIVSALTRHPEAWIDFMMRFELGLEKPNPRRNLTSALTIAGSYIAGGALPLTPYMIFPRPTIALAYSALVTLTALMVFGFIKGRLAGVLPFRSALHTALIGGLAATAAFLLARVIS